MHHFLAAAGHGFHPTLTEFYVLLAFIAGLLVGLHFDRPRYMR